MSGKTVTNVVNEQTIALNALIYGYAGHSLVTPHAALQQIWWTDGRINEKVTVEFITSRVRPNERQWLTQPVGFGELTDDTYMDWIMQRARRLFLVLVEVGESDKIFTVVNNSWDDDDLPLQMNDIEKLSLPNKRNDNVNIRFYHTQFTFLLRELKQGVHIDYAPNEVLPLEYVMGLPPAVTLQHWSRVHTPNRPAEVYVRRKFPLGSAEDPTAFEEEFTMDLQSANTIEHEHIAPVWASYTAKGSGYILTNFVGQHTLRTFIDHRNPTQYQRLPKPERRYLVLNWMHCLADAIVTLHQAGLCHSSIRPSNIIINDRNKIAFADIGTLKTFQKDKKPDPMEVYIYAAPETQLATEAERADLQSVGPSSTIGTIRKLSVASKRSSESSYGGQSQRRSIKTQTNDFTGFNFGFQRTNSTIKPRSRSYETDKADVYSLGCIFLEILTFMVKKKPSDFTKHRSSKQKITLGGKNFRTDSSFHANLESIETWMKIIEDIAFELEDDAFRAVPHITNLIREMLDISPDTRPSACYVRKRLLDILLEYTSIPDVHCRVHEQDITPAPLSSRRASDLSSIPSSWSLMSTTDSDADTIRYSVASSSRITSILNSYSDRSSSLSAMSEYTDDDASVKTVGRPLPPPIDTSPDFQRGAVPSPASSPVSLRSPTSPRIPEN
jgi:serine/threonine protein kinase